MSTLVVVHPSFDGVWPYAANHFQVLWPDADFVRLAHGDERKLGEVVETPRAVTRLVTLGMPVELDCLQKFTALEEATFQGSYGRKLGEEAPAVLEFIEEFTLLRSC